MGFCPSCLSTVTMIEKYERGEQDALTVCSFYTILLINISSSTLGWFFPGKLGQNEKG